MPFSRGRPVKLGSKYQLWKTPGHREGMVGPETNWREAAPSKQAGRPRALHHTSQLVSLPVLLFGPKMTQDKSGPQFW